MPCNFLFYSLGSYKWAGIVILGSLCASINFIYSCSSSWIFSVSYDCLQNLSSESLSGGFLTSTFSLMSSLETLLGFVETVYKKNICHPHLIISILIKHESCLSVCLFVRVFRSHQKSQGHEILALGLIWANLKHDGARFSKF